MHKSNFSQQDAKAWILKNWNFLSKEKRTQALKKYFSMYANGKKIEKTEYEQAKDIFSP